MAAPRNPNPNTKAPIRTETRNTVVPPTAAPSGRPATPGQQGRPRAITHEQIALRAYEISRSGNGGSEFDNWIRAERELRGS